MLAPPSEVEVSHKTNLKSLAHLQPAQIGIFLIARLSDIWGSDGPYGAQMILREAKMSQLSLRAQMGQFGAQMSQLGAQMGQLGAQRGQWGLKWAMSGFKLDKSGWKLMLGNSGLK